MYLRGEIPLEEAVRLLKSNTRKFIRHQANWFRPSDPRIRWFDVSARGYEDVREAVRAVWARRFDSVILRCGFCTEESRLTRRDSSPRSERQWTRA
jgi:hypothetical protein